MGAVIFGLIASGVIGLGFAVLTAWLGVEPTRSRRRSKPWAWKALYYASKGHKVTR